MQNEKSIPSRCERCDVKNNEEHPLQSFIVKLEEVEVSEYEKRYLCQRCKVSVLFKQSRDLDSQKETNTSSNIFKSFFGI